MSCRYVVCPYMVCIFCQCFKFNVGVAYDAWVWRPAGYIFGAEVIDNRSVKFLVNIFVHKVYAGF